MDKRIKDVNPAVSWSAEAGRMNQTQMVYSDRRGSPDPSESDVPALEDW